ncbi:MAG: sulfotransferase [Promethearchaeota archaeon]
MIDKFFLSIMHDKVLRNIARWIFRQNLIFLSQFEKNIIEKNFIPKWPPIFILGTPRSGSTLLYKILVYGLSLSFFCNLVEKFYLCPGIVSLILTKLTKVNPPYNFLSYYGNTSGWNGPNQGRMIRNRLLKFTGEYNKPKEISRNQLIEIRGTIGIIEKAFNMPFISKYQLLCLYIFQLIEAFPNAIFIKVRRNPLQTAQSILNARRELFGDYAAWFSVKPREYEKIENIDPIRQVCEQVYYIEKNRYTISKRI